MKKILIAEDDHAIRELLAEILADWGYEVFQAENGVEALEQLRQAAPDLVLLDVQMPLLDGYGVIARIRSDPRMKALPVVAISAYAMRDDTQRMSRVGFDSHVAKPIDLAAFQSYLRNGFPKLPRSSTENPSLAEIQIARRKA